MFNGSLELKSTNFILKNHGIQPGGPVQKVIDSETMRYMGPYMPRRQAGELEHMMVPVSYTQLDVYKRQPWSCQL